jgi:L-lactate dehydrogenase complex protein LldF
MMRHWREKEFENHLQTKTARYGLSVWAYLVKRPKIYRTLMSFAMPILSLFGGSKQRITSMPMLGAWTRHREFPAPEGRTFMQDWNQREALKQSASS